MTAPRQSLGRAITFAGVAGVATVPYLLAVTPALGTPRAVAYGWVALLAVYLASIAPSWSSAVRIALLSGGVGFGLALVAPGPASAVLATTILMGVLRSGFLFRLRAGRALVIELALVLGGLALARTLGDGGVLHTGLAVWGFFLAQSLYGVIGGIEARPGDEPSPDPFVRARDELNRLMEEIAAG